MARIACLTVPELPLVAALRAEPHPIGAPLAVVQRKVSAERGRAAAQAAREAAAAVSPRGEEAAAGLLDPRGSGLGSPVGARPAAPPPPGGAPEPVGRRAPLG